MIRLPGATPFIPRTSPLNSSDSRTKVVANDQKDVKAPSSVESRVDDLGKDRFSARLIELATAIRVGESTIKSKIVWHPCNYPSDTIQVFKEVGLAIPEFIEKYKIEEVKESSRYGSGSVRYTGTSIDHHIDKRTEVFIEYRELNEGKDNGEGEKFRKIFTPPRGKGVVCFIDKTDKHEDTFLIFRMIDLPIDFLGNVTKVGEPFVEFIRQRKGNPLWYHYKMHDTESRIRISNSYCLQDQSVPIIEDLLEGKIIKRNQYHFMLYDGFDQ